MPGTSAHHISEVKNIANSRRSRQRRHSEGLRCQLVQLRRGEGSPSTGDDGLQIPNGNSLKHVIFCYDVVLDPQISGTKFDDANASGTADAGEAGIPGWEIFLLGDGVNLVDSTVTDANGNYSFPAPAPNLNYVVCEASQGPSGDGWFQTGTFGEDNGVCPDGEGEVDLAPGGYAVDYAEGDSVTGLDFFNFDGDPEAEGQPMPCGSSVSDSDEKGTFAEFFRESTGDCDNEKNALLKYRGRRSRLCPITLARSVFGSKGAMSHPTFRRYGSSGLPRGILVTRQFSTFAHP